MTPKKKIRVPGQVPFFLHTKNASFLYLSCCFCPAFLCPLTLSSFLFEQEKKMAKDPNYDFLGFFTSDKNPFRSASRRPEHCARPRKQYLNELSFSQSLHSDHLEELWGGIQRNRSPTHCLRGVLPLSSVVQVHFGVPRGG